MTTERTTPDVAELPPGVLFMMANGFSQAQADSQAQAEERQAHFAKVAAEHEAIGLLPGQRSNTEVIDD